MDDEIKPPGWPHDLNDDAMFDMNRAWKVEIHNSIDDDCDDCDDCVTMFLNIKGGPIVSAKTKEEALIKFKDAMRVFMLGCTMMFDKDTVAIIYNRWKALMDEIDPKPNRDSN